MEEEGSTSIFLQASLIQHPSMSGLDQDKRRWVQATWKCPQRVSEEACCPGTYCTLVKNYCSGSYCWGCACVVSASLPKKVVQLAVEESSMQLEEYVRQGGRLLGRHGERYGSGARSRGGAEMKSGTRGCCEVRLGVFMEDVALLQRLSRCRGKEAQARAA